MKMLVRRKSWSQPLSAAPACVVRLRSVREFESRQESKNTGTPDFATVEWELTLKPHKAKGFKSQTAQRRFA